MTSPRNSANDIQLAKIGVTQDVFERQLRDMNSALEEFRRVIFGFNGEVGLLARQRRTDEKLDEVGDDIRDVKQSVDNMTKLLSEHIMLPPPSSVTVKKDENDAEVVTWTWVRDKVGQPVLLMVIGYLLSLLPKLIVLAQSIQNAQ